MVVRPPLDTAGVAAKPTLRAGSPFRLKVFSSFRAFVDRHVRAVPLCIVVSHLAFTAVAGNDYPAEVVRSKLLKLNSEHLRFVMDCLKQNTTRIRNIRQYLLATLFNAPSTMNSYYTALVAHDLAA